MFNVVTLILQITVVLVTCRLVGELFIKLRQPRVNGEMFAGILLGPSILGPLAPHFSAFIFPKHGLDFLNALGQLGVVIYMFVAGLDIDPAEIKKHARAAASSSLVSTLAPILLAYPLALYLYPRVGMPGVSFLNFTLFLGAATSITAFPMLARILGERGILSTRLGIVSVSAAVAAAVASWCVLAYVVLLIRSAKGTTAWMWTVGGIIVFGLIMFTAGRRLLRWYGQVFSKDQKLSDRAMASILILALAAGVCTGYLGLHPLFGAFVLGMIMPKDARLTRYLTARLEPITLAVLLPLFFAFSGLRTNLGTIRGAQMWMCTGIIILVSILGKAVAPMLTAWGSRMPLREAAGLGALLNTRGLIALVVFDMGLTLKVITVPVFSMLVVMALFNTVLTPWLLDIFCPTRLLRSVPKTATKLGAAEPI